MSVVDPFGGLGSSNAPAPQTQPTARQAIGKPPSTPSTWALLTVLSGFFLLQSYLGNWDTQEPLAVFRLGALNWLAVLDGDWFRIGSYSFLHFGLAHFVLNAWALWFLMRMVESAYGSASALGIYAISAIGGGVASLISAIHGGNPLIVAAGASGGIAGLFGGYFGLYLRVRKHIPPEAARATLQMLLVNLGLNVLLAFNSGGIALDNSAHLGGLATGFVFSLLAPLAILPRRPWRRPAQVALIAGTLVLAAMEGAAVSRAFHPHTRTLDGQGFTAQVPWELVPIDGEGKATSPGGVGLHAIVEKLDEPLSIDAGTEAVPIGEQTWLRSRSKGSRPGQEVQTLTGKNGAGSWRIRVLCDDTDARGQLADDAAIEIARTLRDAEQIASQRSVEPGAQ